MSDVLIFGFSISARERYGCHIVRLLFSYAVFVVLCLLAFLSMSDFTHLHPTSPFGLPSLRRRLRRARRGASVHSSGLLYA